MSSAVFESFYRQIFTDLSVTPEESDEIKEKILETNPPPDKLIWLRSSAFRIGSEFLSDGDGDVNVSLLRCINAICHAIETTAMLPLVPDTSDSFDEDGVETFLRNIYADLSLDVDESKEVMNHFKEENVPPKSKLLWSRSTAFRIGCDFLSEEKSDNIKLLKCINAVVHAMEVTCMKPKPYKVKEEAVKLDISLSEAVQCLWDLDVNRLTPGEDYVIDVQGGKKPYWKDDKAKDPLFTFVNDRELQRRTYKAFMALLDNYSAQVGEGESVTYAEKKENWTFLHAIMQTGPMQFCHKYCVANSKKGGLDIPEDPEDFKKILYKIWFDLYYRERGGGRDSSGFEHVFVGEVKNGKVTGFHNWLAFLLEERLGRIDYRGYIKPKSYSDAPTNDDDHVLTLQFNWNGVPKSVGTSFIGVSPEFEMALYTMCFLVGEEQNTIDLDTGADLFKLNCKVYTMDKDKIGTSFVETLEHED